MSPELGTLDPEAVVARMGDESLAATERAWAVSRFAASAAADKVARLRSILRTVDEPAVVWQAAQALARHGGPEDLKTLLDAGVRAGPRAHEGARFPATLLAYRLGIRGSELPVLDPDRLPDRRAAVSNWLPLRPGDGTSDPTPYSHALQQQVSGIRFDEDSACELVCRSVSRMLFVTEGTNDLERLRERPSLLGAVVARIDCGPVHGLDLWVMGTPRGASLEIQVRTLTGRLAYGGNAELEGGVWRFQLRAARSLMPVELHGAIGPGRVAFSEARVAFGTSETAQHPTPL